jgi:hypothetical protein
MKVIIRDITCQAHADAARYVLAMLAGFNAAVQEHEKIEVIDEGDIHE